MGWPAVQGYEDGDPITAARMNTPLNQLAERTEFLKNQAARDGSEKVIITGEISNKNDAGLPVAGEPVYRAPDGTYALAGGFPPAASSAWFYAVESAMAVGVVVSTAGDSTAQIVLNGYYDFGESNKIDASTLISDDTPVCGRYYLAAAYGKYTSSPNGPVIYVCDFRIEQDDDDGKYYITSMIVNPQYRDTGESHVHKAFVLGGKPMGGYAIKGSSVFELSYIWPKNEAPATGSLRPLAALAVFGSWPSSAAATYTVTIEKINQASADTSWANYRLAWSASSGDESGISTFTMSGGVSDVVALGTLGAKVKIICSSSSVTPADVSSKQWIVAMPTAGQAWSLHSVNSGVATYRYNLGMHPEMAKYVPPLPQNGASLSADGVETNGPVFDSRKRWYIDSADSDIGGPWLYWLGGQIGDSATAPFKYVSDTAKATERDLQFTVNTMRVGPTGFVTSLQPAPDAPIKITSAQTGADANQGALQIDLDVDFTTEDANEPGSSVIKAIEGTKFKTGPVVEQIVAGPGTAITPSSGQGIVTVSVSNAVYAGDFETIALKNAKQDLAGGIFPYTKLLGWKSSGNIDSGFTAKFRVPDHIPWKKYNVIVSASVFGESALASGDSTAKAAFSLINYSLADYACASNAPDVSASYPKAITSPVKGYDTSIPVAFNGGYSAFDPILIHGFSEYTDPDSAQRQEFDALLLKQSDGVSRLAVYPGWFVGLAIARTSPGASATLYTAPLGFLSLRWNLVEDPDQDD